MCLPPCCRVQGIVDAYGIARYREANPAVFTIITFPFLFAVMFGDIGHGLLMLAFALYLVLSEAKLARQDLGDILGMLFGGRYIILLMAGFSIYTGLIYNEFFSIVTTIFGPSRFVCATDASISDVDAIKMDPSLCPSAFSIGLAQRDPGAAYAFGVDPAWHGTRTELPYLNSVKMKMSILLGVAQVRTRGMALRATESFSLSGCGAGASCCVEALLSFMLLGIWRGVGCALPGCMYCLELPPRSADRIECVAPTSPCR